jgi:NtrC-family two-component system sensor histidine kinase KinB
MTLKRKLSLGLGFLFLIIFVLVVFYSLYIGKLSRDADNILKDNYKSLVYSKNMLSALEDLRTAVIGLVFNPPPEPKSPGYYLQLLEDGEAAFGQNLEAERANLTEDREKDYVDVASSHFGLLRSLGSTLKEGRGDRTLYFNEFQPTFEKLKQAVLSIDDVNMQAVERKSRAARRDSDRIISSMALVGIMCLILAFGYFWYFPFYVSSSVAYLAGRMKDLLKAAGLTFDLKMRDEMHFLLQGINLLDSKLNPKT